MLSVNSESDLPCIAFRLAALPRCVKPVPDTRHRAGSGWSTTSIRDGDGNVTMAINVIEDITAHKRAEMSQRFLARSAEVLASSMDPDELLTGVAKLAVPEMADWWPWSS